MKKGLLLAAIAIMGCITFMSCQSSPKKTAESVAAFPVAVRKCGFTTQEEAQAWCNQTLSQFGSTYPQVRNPQATVTEEHFGSFIYYCGYVGGNVVIL